MNCPQCDAHMTYIGIFIPSAGRVYRCQKCGKRWSEREIETMSLCASCGAAIGEHESLCADCDMDLMENEISFE